MGDSVRRTSRAEGGASGIQNHKISGTSNLNRARAVNPKNTTAGASAALTKLNGNSLMNNSEVGSIFCEIPIAGWESNI